MLNEEIAAEEAAAENDETQDSTEQLLLNGIVVIQVGSK
jgi:hypothetical protein